MSEFRNGNDLTALERPQLPVGGMRPAGISPAAGVMAGPAGLARRVLDSLVMAALVCDVRGRVVLANAAGRRLARDGILQFGVGVGDPGIATLDRIVTKELRRAIADAAQFLARQDAGGVVLVPRPAPRPGLLANVAPLGGTGDGSFALVLIQDPLDLDTAIERHLREGFGATPAEARLGAALARGATRQEHAAAMGVKASTVKTQLCGLFMKTETRREADLIRVLLTIPRFAREAGSAAHVGDGA